MSILRLRIATADDPAIQDAASKQLQSDTDDYRLAKKQYERSDCEDDSWSRD